MRFTCRDLEGKNTTLARPQLDSTRLVAQAEGGNVEALAGLFEQYRNRLRQTIRLRMDVRLLGRLDVSDVLQEAFLDAARRLPEYTAAPHVSLFIWLRSLAIQRLVDLQRMHVGAKRRSVTMEVRNRIRHHSNASTQSISDLLVDSSPTPGAEAVRLEMSRHVRESLLSMDAIDHEVLVMRHFESMTNKEVARVMGLTKAAASNRYVRALQRLHTVLQGKVDDN